MRKFWLVSRPVNAGLETVRIAFPLAFMDVLARAIWLGLALGLLCASAYAQSDEDQGYAAGKQAYLAGKFDEAYRIWRPLAESGDPVAQFSLGSLYFEGNGVIQDFNESALWFERSAAQGYAPAQFNLGNAYKHGQGLEADDLKATEWWRQAGEQEFAPAQYNLGTQYYFGRGVEQDRAQAIRWYRRAAKNGHVQAQSLFTAGPRPEEPAVTALASDQSGGGKSAAATSGRTSAEENSARAAADGAGSAGSVAVETARATDQALRGSKAETAAAASNAGRPVTQVRRSGNTSSPVETKDEAWLLEQAPGNYTVQLLASQDQAALLKYLKRLELGGAVATFGFTRGGKRWYAAVHGVYGNPSDAKAAMDTLPGSLRKTSPWIRRFKSIQTAIKP